MVFGEPFGTWVFQVFLPWGDRGSYHLGSFFNSCVCQAHKMVKKHLCHRWSNFSLSHNFCVGTFWLYQGWCSKDWCVGEAQVTFSPCFSSDMSKSPRIFQQCWCYSDLFVSEWFLIPPTAICLFKSTFISRFDSIWNIPLGCLNPVTEDASIGYF